MGDIGHRAPLPGNRWIAAEVVGSGTNVLLVHGIPGVGATWRAVRERLAPEHRVIVPDLVGFGCSVRTDDLASLWADAQADAVLALLDALAVPRAVVVGHDFGGPVAAHLVAKAPGRVAGLVLAATNAFGDTPIPFPLRGILWPGLGRLWARLLFSPPSLRSMVRRGLGPGAPSIDASAHVGDADQARAIFRIFDTALRELRVRYAPVTEALRQVRVATRVVWGDRDPFFPVEQARRTADLIDGATVTILPGAGHFLPEERPNELAAVVAELCRGVMSPAAPEGVASACTADDQRRSLARLHPER
jgi:pimeloyl-ACP methyl ester carboxylesterase